MTSSLSATRRKSLRLHKLILGSALTAAVFGVSQPAARAQVVRTLGAGSTVIQNDNIQDPTGGGAGDVLSFDNDAALVAAGGTNTQGDSLNLGGQILVMGGNDLTGAVNITSINVNGGTLDIGVGDSSITTALTGTGLTVNGGANTLTLGTASNFDGAVAVSGGAILNLTAQNTGDANYTISNASRLTIGIANAIAATSDVTLANTARLEVNNNLTMGTLASAAAGTRVDLAAGTTLTFGEAASATYAGIVNGAATTNLIKQGTGTQTFSLNNGANFLGSTTINAGTIRYGADNALGVATNMTINNGGTLNLGGFTGNHTVVTAPGSTITNGTLVGTVNAQGGTINNVSGGAALNLNSGSISLTGVNSFGNIALNGGTTTVAVPATGTPLTSTGTVSAGGGTLSLDASSLTKAQVEGDKTIVAGNVDDSVASSTTFTFGGRTERFGGFNKPLEGVGLYDIQLKKGSVILSVQRKGADDICGVTGLCATGQSQGKLEGLDRSEIRSLYGKVVLPALEAGRLDLPFWTTNTQISKYLISGLMPRNVDAAGSVLSSYNDRMADTLFERLPLRQFDPVEVAEEEIIEEVKTTEPVRGLWKTTAEGEVLEVNGQTYQENTSLTAQYSERDNMRAWVRGFGGDVAAAQTTKYIYKDYNATNAGGVVGVDYSVFDDFQVGIYANYGDLAINTDSNKYAGSGSWNPTGWGGGIIADYWTNSYYVQGLFGASAFSGDQDRSIVAIGGDLGGGNTLSGNKNVTSYVGALRAGVPMQIGSFYLEPQAQATWSGNQEDSFTEGGNSNFKLKYKSRETNFLQTELGFKLAYPIALGTTQQLVPSVRLAWLGDWNMDNQGQKIGYRFSNKTIDLESYQKDQNGALLEGGLDYTVANIGATSFKVYGRGGAEVWDTDRGTNWRASGGVTLQF